MTRSTALRGSLLLLGVPPLLGVPLGCGDEGDTIYVYQSGGAAGSGGDAASGRMGSGGNRTAGGSAGEAGSANGGSSSGASGGTNGSSGGASGSGGANASGGTNEGGAGASGGSNGGTAGNVTGGSANGGTGGTGSGTCSGTPTTCDNLNQSQCDNQLGCGYYASCMGVTIDCAELNELGPTWCNEEPNCTWNDNSDTCEGETPPTCTQRDPEECLTLGSGCYLDEGCLGAAYECSTFLLAGPCSMHLGCTWQ